MARKLSSPLDNEPQQQRARDFGARSLPVFFSAVMMIVGLRTRTLLRGVARVRFGSANKKPGEFLFTGRRGPESGMTTRQYARLVAQWIGSVGLDPGLFGAHSLRRTKATLIYWRTGNLRAVQLLVGHTKIESTVRYLGIEVDDALAIAEQVDV